ncbi:MAG: phage tail protein [Pseudomonadota bacterium]
MLMSLGMFVFERTTLPFDQRQQRLSWNHASSDRVGARAALQFTGPGDENETITGCLYPEAGASYSSIETIKDMATPGEAYPLVEGTGAVLGNYVITDLDLTRRAFIDNGAPRAIDFTLTLKRKD